MHDGDEMYLKDICYSVHIIGFRAGHLFIRANSISYQPILGESSTKGFDLDS